jgi:hypothetical protein
MTAPNGLSVPEGMMILIDTEAAGRGHLGVVAPERTERLAREDHFRHHRCSMLGLPDRHCQQLPGYR